MARNDGVKFTTSSIKVSSLCPHLKIPFFATLPFCSQTLASNFMKTRDSVTRLISALTNSAKHDNFVAKRSLLSFSSLSLSESTQSEGREIQQKGHVTSRYGRVDEERVLISEVVVRNKDGEELERKDLEFEAVSALKACRPNSALTVREVQDDVHRIIGSGYFSSCMPVALDTRDGIRLVFQVELAQFLFMFFCFYANEGGIPSLWLPLKEIEGSSYGQ